MESWAGFSGEAELQREKQSEQQCGGGSMGKDSGSRRAGGGSRARP